MYHNLTKTKRQTPHAAMYVWTVMPKNMKECAKLRPPFTANLVL